MGVALKPSDQFQLSRMILAEAIYFQLAILRCLLILSADDEEGFSANGTGVKNSPANGEGARRCGFNPWVKGKIHWQMKGHPISGILAW